ncbi:unnamed protein product [Cuscuta campestris]|uniref:RING-type domain-containing protein n=1 Tax=Cuscuta campestris TaxID=132261 RepID=A0A484MSD3_9ASTE|nr:unnamed protein product [Cuscuta campestris]
MGIVYTVIDEEKEKAAKEAKEERTCPICMNMFEPDEKRSKMICCPQVFHCDCISTWQDVPLVPVLLTTRASVHKGHY